MSVNKIIIEKGVALVERWDPKIRENVRTRKIEQTLSDALQFDVELVCTTFAQFWAFIEKEAELYEKIFCASMFGHPLKPYIDECKRPPIPSPEIFYLEIYWFCQSFEGEFSLSPGFHGFGSWVYDGMPADYPKEGGISIEYTALNEYKDIELKLDRSLIVGRLDDKPNELALGKLEFTVYDLIRAILFEITWAGDISKGRKSFKELHPSNKEDGGNKNE